MTFQVPTNFPSDFPETAGDDYDELDDTHWFSYRYMSNKYPTWPGMIETTNREKAKLTDIIRGVNTMMYDSPNQTIQANHIIERYRQYTAWREALPSALGYLENNGPAFPHPLSLLYVLSQ